MGKNSLSTGKAAGKGKTEGEQSSKLSTVTPTLKNNSSPAAPSLDTGSTLIGSLEDLKTNIDVLLRSATAVQATSLPMHLDSLQSHLTNSARILSENERLQQLLDQKDDEIKTSQEQLSRLLKGWAREENEYQRRLDEANGELEAALAGQKSLSNDINELVRRHEKEKRDLETQLQHSIDARIEYLESNHQKDACSLKNRLEDLQNQLTESQERLQHSEAQSSCIVLEKTQLIRETERTKRECTHAKERFDRLIYRQDDTILGAHFDQLANDIINFVVRFAQNINSPVDTQKMPQLQAVSNCGFIPLTDSSCSKILRISWAVQYISRSFLKYLFQPFGQHMNRDDQKRIAQLKDYSRALLSKDPMKEAIWRNLTLQAMKDSGEYGFLTSNGNDLAGKQKHDRDILREELYQPEMETLLPVLNADKSLMEDMNSELNSLIRTAAEIWIDARRNFEPIEASQDVSFSNDSDWDNRYTEFMGMAIPYEREAGGNGVQIDNLVDTDLDSVYTRSGDDSSRLVKLCLFPKILRVSQGTPVVIHQGLALFEGGSLVAQGEEEVADERLREIKLQKLKRKRHFSQSHTRMDSTSSRRASQSHSTPAMDTTTATIVLSCNFSNHSTISTAEGNLADIGGSGSALNLEMIASPIQKPAMCPEMPELMAEQIKD
ncbi:hypothetical protein EV426DRAFT_717585 [Tirmania nivea]|nr:hypothetical protein EV426DRAFT_717585 [Tirmania nivea]